MLTDLPELFNGSQETDSCLGAALQAAYKMVNTPSSSFKDILFVYVYGNDLGQLWNQFYCKQC